MLRLLGLLVLFYTTTAVPEECIRNDNPLVIAMLALHSGTDCKLVVQQGAQQMAALELTLEELNSANPDLKFDIKVMDTCSSKEETVKTGLRALVYVEQACSKPPVFLGFLGPNDPASLRAVTKVSGLFQHTHVVPTAVRSFGQFNTINVAVVEPSKKAKNIKLLLKDMNWASFLLVHTSDPPMTQTAASLMESRDLCILQSVLQIPSSTENLDGSIAYNKLLHFLQQVDDARVVLLCDTAASAEGLLEYLDGSVPQARFLVYLQGSGILPWKLSLSVANKVHILQETTKTAPEGFIPYLENSTLWSTYLQQHTPHESCNEVCKAPPVVLDSSILPLSHALHLYAHGLMVLQANTCTAEGKGLCPRMMRSSNDEWRAALEGSKSFSAGHKVHFYMEVEDNVDIFLHNDTGFFEQIGSISNGKYLSLRSIDGLFMASPEQKAQCDDSAYHMATEPPPTTTEEPAEDTDERDLFGLVFTHSEIEYWGLVGVLIGVAFGICLFISCVICIVYRSFRVKPKDQYSEASSTSARGGSPERQQPPKNKTKKERRFSFRSNSS